MTRDFGSRVDLLPGESILWEGRPASHFRVRPGDVSSIVLGFVMFCLSSLTALIASIFLMFEHQAVTLIVIVLAAPFIVTSAYLLLGQFVADARHRRHSRYLLTNQRALIETRTSNYQLISVRLREIDDISLDLNANGAGSIRLGAKDRQVDIGRQQIRRPFFDTITEAEHVYSLAVRARNGGV